MKSFNKLILFVFIAVVSATIFFGPMARADDNNVNMYLFWGDGCPHCAKEKDYINSILSDYPTVKLNTYEVYFHPENITYMQEIAKTLGIEANGVPFLVIGDKGIIGFGEGTTDKEIIAQINNCLLNTCSDSIASIFDKKIVENSEEETLKKPEVEDAEDGLSTEDAKPIVVEKNDKKIITLPFLGEIDALNFSLPILTIFIGALDGFNPCAMWTLLFLISLLLGIDNRRRMWVLGIAFIMASALVYFLFMAAWLNLILFLGFVVWVRVAIGGLAIFGGGHNLKSYIKNKDKTGCDVTGSEKRQAVFAKMKIIAQQNSLWLSLGGIILLAFAVNLVELICSAGLPAIYTQVLTLSGLSTWQYYGYIMLYIFFFMLDDIIIFAIAMITLKATGISTKYGKVSKLIGGIIMIIIGLLLIFKPDWLMFG